MDQLDFVEVSGQLTWAERMSAPRARVTGGERPTGDDGTQARHYAWRIEIHDFTISATSPSRQRDGLSIAYRLFGPTSFWPRPRVDGFTEPSPKYGLREAALELGGNFRGEASILTWPVTADVEYDGRTIHGIEWVTAVRFVSSDQMSDEEFAGVTTKIVDDLCLLASFTGRGIVNWYQYALEGASRVVFHRGMHTGDLDDDAWRDDAAFPWDAAKTFLPMGLDKIREWRGHGIELRDPIHAVAYAPRVPTPEQRYLMYFAAIEQLKDMYAKSRRCEFLIGSSAWDRLASALRRTIESTVELSPEVTGGIALKLPELRRRSIKEVLARMEDEFGVGLVDLYPDGVAPSFIKTRNLLTHSADSMDHEELMRETYRVQSLAERFIYRMLGVSVDDCVEALPPKYRRKQLTEKRTDSAIS